MEVVNDQIDLLGKGIGRAYRGPSILRKGINVCPGNEKHRQQPNDSISREAMACRCRYEKPAEKWCEHPLFRGAQNARDNSKNEESDDVQTGHGFSASCNDSR